MTTTSKQTIECDDKDAVTITITEAPDVVYVAIDGPQLTRAQDLEKVYRVMFLLIQKYEDDPRPLELSGSMTGFSSCVHSDGELLVATTPNESTDG